MGAKPFSRMVVSRSRCQPSPIQCEQSIRSLEARSFSHQSLCNFTSWGGSPWTFSSEVYDELGKEKVQQLKLVTLEAPRVANEMLQSFSSAWAQRILKDLNSREGSFSLPD